MTWRVLVGRRRLLRLSLALVLAAAVAAALAWATHDTAPTEHPMDVVELQRSPTDATVVRVLEAATNNAMACYRFESSNAASAAIAVASESRAWDAGANLFVARLTTATGGMRAPAVMVNPRLDAYDGRLRLDISDATKSVQRVMASQDEAERLAFLLQQGAWVTGQSTHLLEQTPNLQTFSLQLGDPLPDADCPHVLP